MQDEKRNIGIAQNDWLKIELLNDLLSEPGDPSTRLQKALAFLMESLGYSQAALLIHSRAQDKPNLWIPYNLSSQQLDQINDPTSTFNQIAQTVYTTGAAFPADVSLNLATVFPLLYHDETIGILFVFGPAIISEDMPRWSAYLKALARANSFLNINENYPAMEQDLLFLDKLLSIQKESPHNAEQIQRAVLNRARELFHAQDALLILFEEDSTSLIIQKQLSEDEKWIERRILVSEESAVYQLLLNAKNNGFNLQAVPEFTRWLSLETDYTVNNAVCSLLRSKEKVNGVLVFTNPKRDMTDPVLKGFSQLLSSVLANSIDLSREISGLKILIADLEANRWEIINSRNTLRTFFDSIPASVYIIDRAYNLISINIHRSNRVQKHPNMLVGKKCYEQLYNRMEPCPACRAMETFGNTSITNRYNREWIDQDRFIEWEITTFPIQEKDKPVHQVILFEEDVTEKRTLEANLIQSEKLAAVGQLAAGVAHEINNPLAAIIANAQLLKRELPKDNEDLVSSVSLIEMAGVRASQVVSNLLGIARKEKKYEYEMISLNDTLLSALSLVNHEIVNHSINVVMDLQEDLPDIIASKNHLQGVWINMIVNGIDSIDKPGGQISISTRYSNNEFRVTIADNGKGIPQEHLTNIFEPFFTTKVAGKGTGLGLSVSLRVIKEHQGNIIVESQIGVGTKFIILLPNLVRKNL